MIKASEIGWIAGFLEGEGHFRTSKGTPEIRASQVQRQPLDRLQALVGGLIRDCPSDARRQPHSEWALRGSAGAALMMTIYSLMSPKRKGRILQSLELWKAGPGKGWHKSLEVCGFGHRFDAYTPKAGGKGAEPSCLMCRELYDERRRHFGQTYHRLGR